MGLRSKRRIMRRRRTTSLNSIVLGPAQQVVDDLALMHERCEVALVMPHVELDSRNAIGDAARRRKRDVLVIVAMPPSDRRLNGRHVEVPIAMKRHRLVG